MREIHELADALDINETIWEAEGISIKDIEPTDEGLILQDEAHTLDDIMEAHPRPPRGYWEATRAQAEQESRDRAQWAAFLTISDLIEDYPQSKFTRLVNLTRQNILLRAQVYEMEKGLVKDPGGEETHKV